MLYCQRVGKNKSTTDFQIIHFTRRRDESGQNIEHQVVENVLKKTKGDCQGDWDFLGHGWEREQILYLYFFAL